MTNATTESRRHNRYRIDMTGAPADLDRAMTALNAHPDAVTALQGLVAFVEDLEATHCGLDDFTGNYPALPDALAFARAAIEKARPR